MCRILYVLQFPFGILFTVLFQISLFTLSVRKHCPFVSSLIIYPCLAFSFFYACTACVSSRVFFTGCSRCLVSYSTHTSRSTTWFIPILLFEWPSRVTLAQRSYLAFTSPLLYVHTALVELNYVYLLHILYHLMLSLSFSLSHCLVSPLQYWAFKCRLFMSLPSLAVSSPVLHVHTALS